MNQHRADGRLQFSEGLINRLVAEHGSLQAQLNDMLRIAPSNPSIPALQGRIAAIGPAIGAQTGRAVGNTTGIAAKLGSYENRWRNRNSPRSR